MYEELGQTDDTGTERAAQRRCLVYALLIIGALTLLRIGLLAINPYSLYGDEAYYWGWSRELAFGYYSKPPMLAWVIALTTAIGGNGEFWVRLGSPVLYAGTSLLVFSVARRLYGPRVALTAGAFFATLPAVFLGSMVISTDAVFLFFWALALRFFIEAIRTDQWRWWLLAGVAGGCGMLSKYTMVIAALSCFLFVVTSARLRTRLLSSKVWCGVLVALLLYLPNLLWNASNHFASYLHTKDNASLEGDLFHPTELLEFLGAQFGVFGPVVFGFLLVLLVRPWRSFEREEDRLLFWFTAPMLLVICLVAFLSRAHANWAAPSTVSATIWVAAILVRGRRRRWLGAALAVNLVLGLGVYAYHPVAKGLGIELTSKTDPYKRLRGWRAAGREVADALRAHPDARLLADDRMVLAEMIYYARPLAFDAAKWNPRNRMRDHYDLTTDISEADGQDFIYVTERTNPEKVQPHFESVHLLKEIRIPLYTDFDRTLNVYHLRTFRGYSRGDAEESN